MVFAINCGANDAPNSFTNFKNAALAYGASLSASPSPSPYTLAAYGGYTIPLAPTPIPTTQVITLGAKVWTTTYASYPNSPDPTPVSPEGEVHTVSVGASDALAFSPSRISARPFDIVKFVLYVLYPSQVFCGLMHIPTLATQRITLRLSQPLTTHADHST